jgi:hypothetical protein
LPRREHGVVWFLKERCLAAMGESAPKAKKALKADLL